MIQRTLTHFKNTLKATLNQTFHFFFLDFYVQFTRELGIIFKLTHQFNYSK